MDFICVQAPGWTGCQVISPFVQTHLILKGNGGQENHPIKTDFSFSPLIHNGPIQLYKHVNEMLSVVEESLDFWKVLSADLTTGSARPARPHDKPNAIRLIQDETDSRSLLTILSLSMSLSHGKKGRKEKKSRVKNIFIQKVNNFCPGDKKR